MTDKTQKTTNAQLEEAARLLAQNQQQRMQACMEEIEAILSKYGFVLAVGTPTLSLKPRDQQE